MPDIETIQALLAEVDALLRQSRKTQTDLRDQQDKLLRERVGLQLTLERLGGTENGSVQEEVHEDGEPQTSEPSADTDFAHPVESDSQQVLTPMPTPIADSWVHMNRIQAVEAALREIGHPTDRKEIGRVLWRHGRDDKVGDVSAALSYLRRKATANRRDDGRWALLAGVAAGALALGTFVLAENSKENAPG